MLRPNAAVQELRKTPSEAFQRKWGQRYLASNGGTMALISLWNFDDPATVSDSVTTDGTAQDGTYVNGASAPSGALVLDGSDDYAMIPSDPGFQLDQGTLTLAFTPTTSNSGTVFSRDSKNFDEGGHFMLKTTGSGGLQIRHQDEASSHYFNVGSGFFDPGDNLKVVYSWSSDGSGGEFVVENLTQGTTHSETINIPLTWDQGATNEPITLGTSQHKSSDNAADNLKDYFAGQIDYVAIYDTVEPAGAVICFAGDTLIQTTTGPRRASDIAVGDTVITQNNGPQPVVWVGRRKLHPLDLILQPKLCPIRIKAGALGGGLPQRDLRVSRQHRLLLEIPAAEAAFGTAKVFIAANKLLPLPGVEIDSRAEPIEYAHILCDDHQIVFADGAPAETLLPGPQAQRLVGPQHRLTLQEKSATADDPTGAVRPAAPIPRGSEQKRLIATLLMQKTPAAV